MGTKLPSSTLRGDSGALADWSLSTLPILMLHVHEHCNCRCLMCDIWKKTDGKELDLKEVAALQDLAGR